MKIEILTCERDFEIRKERAKKENPNLYFSKEKPQVGDIIKYCCVGGFSGKVISLNPFIIFCNNCQENHKEEPYKFELIFREKNRV